MMAAKIARSRCCASCTAAGSRLKIVRLKRNFGQTAAMAAGLAYAEGEIIIVMDGDGQNDPADIPELIERDRRGQRSGGGLAL